MLDKIEQEDDRVAFYIDYLEREFDMRPLDEVIAFLGDDDLSRKAFGQRWEKVLVDELCHEFVAMLKSAQSKGSVPVLTSRVAQNQGDHKGKKLIMRIGSAIRWLDTLYVTTPRQKYEARRRYIAAARSLLCAEEIALDAYSPGYGHAFLKAMHKKGYDKDQAMRKNMQDLVVAKEAYPLLFPLALDSYVDRDAMTSLLRVKLLYYKNLESTSYAELLLDSEEAIDALKTNKVIYLNLLSDFLSVYESKGKRLDLSMMITSFHQYVLEAFSRSKTKNQLSAIESWFENCMREVNMHIVCSVCKNNESTGFSSASYQCKVDAVTSNLIDLKVKSERGEFILGLVDEIHPVFNPFTCDELIKRVQKGKEPVFSEDFEDDHTYYEAMKSLHVNIMGRNPNRYYVLSKILQKKLFYPADWRGSEGHKMNPLIEFSTGDKEYLFNIFHSFSTRLEKITCRELLAYNETIERLIKIWAMSFKTMKDRGPDRALYLAVRKKLLDVLALSIYQTRTSNDLLRLYGDRYIGDISSPQEAAILYETIASRSFSLLTALLDFKVAEEAMEILGSHQRVTCRLGGEHSFAILQAFLDLMISDKSFAASMKGSFRASYPTTIQQRYAFTRLQKLLKDPRYKARFIISNNVELDVKKIKKPFQFKFIKPANGFETYDSYLYYVSFSSKQVRKAQIAYNDIRDINLEDTNLEKDDELNLFDDTQVISSAPSVSSATGAAPQVLGN